MRFLFESGVYEVCAIYKVCAVYNTRANSVEALNAAG